MPVRLLLIDDDGREWLARDGVVQRKRFLPTALGDHYARFRVFDLKEPRVRKVYLFPKDVQNAVNGITLERRRRTHRLVAVEFRARRVPGWFAGLVQTARSPTPAGDRLAGGRKVGSVGAGGDGSQRSTDDARLFAPSADAPEGTHPVRKVV